jgi:hypothetical protein
MKSEHFVNNQTHSVPCKSRGLDSFCRRVLCGGKGSKACYHFSVTSFSDCLNHNSELASCIADMRPEVTCISYMSPLSCMWIYVNTHIILWICLSLYICIYIYIYINIQLENMFVYIYIYIYISNSPAGNLATVPRLICMNSLSNVVPRVSCWLATWLVAGC